MSDMSPALPVAPEPVRLAVRRLRWFRAALIGQLDAISAETGVTYEVNDRALAAMLAVSATLVDVGSGFLLDACTRDDGLADLELLGAAHADLARAGATYTL